MGKRKYKRFKKKKQDQNFLTIIIAIIAVLVLIIAYFTWNKNKQKTTIAPEIEPIPIDPRYIILAELEKERDILHRKRYQLYQKLCEFNVIERWCKDEVERIFKLGRWFLFLLVLSGFIVTWFKSINFLGLTTTDFLKVINATGVLIFLLYFASSDSNDSLMKCYHNSKQVAVKIFMKLIYWYYKKYYKIEKDKKEDLMKNLNVIFLELQPVIEKIKNIKKELNQSNNGQNQTT